MRKVAIFALTLCLISIGATLISSFVALGFATTGLLGLILLLSLFSILILIGTAIFKKRFKCVLLGIILLLAIFAIKYIGNSYTKKLHVKTRLKGDRIINAIIAYKQDEDKLPNAINDITPKYIDSILTPAFINSQFSYVENRKEETFVLYYNAPAWLICEKTPNKDWCCSD